MLQNTVLQTMSVNDLNQRYGETFVQYDNKIIWIENFFVDDCIKISSNILSGDKFVPQESILFKWNLLNTSRPRSRWYLGPTGPVFLRLLVNKQFSRGLSESVCRTFSPRLGEELSKSSFIRYVPEFLDDHNQDIEWKLKLDVEFVYNLLKEKETVMLSPLFILDQGVLWYRTMSVGTIFDKKNIVLTKRFIIEEVRECLIGSTITVGR